MPSNCEEAETVLDVDADRVADDECAGEGTVGFLVDCNTVGRGGDTTLEAGPFLFRGDLLLLLLLLLL